MYVGPEIWAALLVFTALSLFGLIAWCAVLTGKLRHLRSSQRAAENAAEDCRLMRQGTDKVVVLRAEYQKQVGEYTNVTLDVIDRMNLFTQLLRVEQSVPPLVVPESLIRPEPPPPPAPEQQMKPPAPVPQPPAQSENGDGPAQVFQKPKTLPDEEEEAERIRKAKDLAEERRRKEQEEAEIGSPQEQHRTLEGEMKNLPLSEQLAIQRIEQAKDKTGQNDWDDY